MDPSLWGTTGGGGGFWIGEWDSALPEIIIMFKKLGQYPIRSYVKAGHPKVGKEPRSTGQHVQRAAGREVLALTPADLEERVLVPF